MRSPTSATAFVAKLWRILEDETSCHALHWLSGGHEFEITDPEALGKDILPAFFKHANYASFIRQLNAYDFRKKGGRGHVVYHHPNFRRDRPELLKDVKRRLMCRASESGSESRSESASSPESTDAKADLEAALQELKRLEISQADWDKRMSSECSLRSELRHEMEELCSSHQQQSKAVTGILAFLSFVLSTTTGPEGETESVRLALGQLYAQLTDCLRHPAYAPKNLGPIPASSAQCSSNQSSPALLLPLAQQRSSSQPLLLRTRFLSGEDTSSTASLVEEADATIDAFVAHLKSVEAGLRHAAEEVSDAMETEELPRTLSGVFVDLARHSEPLPLQ